VFVGKAALFAEIDGSPVPEAVRSVVENLEGRGRTTMVVRRGHQYLGVLGLMDTPRPGATSVISQLRDLGISRKCGQARLSFLRSCTKRRLSALSKSRRCERSRASGRMLNCEQTGFPSRVSLPQLKKILLGSYPLMQITGSISNGTAGAKSGQNTYAKNRKAKVRLAATAPAAGRMSHRGPSIVCWSPNNSGVAASGHSRGSCARGDADRAGNTRRDKTRRGRETHWRVLAFLYSIVQRTLQLQAIG
jgi:hypothetical protein